MRISLVLTFLSLAVISNAAPHGMHFTRRRFGQEHTPEADKTFQDVKDLAAGSDKEAQAGNLSGAMVRALLAKAPACDQQDRADEVIDLGREFGGEKEDQFIEVAKTYRQLERNTPKDGQPSELCKKAPRNKELEGLTQAQDPTGNPKDNPKDNPIEDPEEDNPKDNPKEDPEEDNPKDNPKEDPEEDKPKDNPKGKPKGKPKDKPKGKPKDNPKEDPEEDNPKDNPKEDPEEDNPKDNPKEDPEEDNPKDNPKEDPEEDKPKDNPKENEPEEDNPPSSGGDNPAESDPVGGVKMPRIQEADDGFIVNGNKFNDIEAAQNRQCDIQHNLCFNKFNAGDRTFSGSDCDEQTNTCKNGSPVIE